MNKLTGNQDITAMQEIAIHMNMIMYVVCDQPRTELQNIRLAE